jgi:hypothetical protein
MAFSIPQELDASPAGIIVNTDFFFPLHNARLFPRLIVEYDHPGVL